MWKSGTIRNGKSPKALSLKCFSRRSDQTGHNRIKPSYRDCMIWCRVGFRVRKAYLWPPGRFVLCTAQFFIAKSIQIGDGFVPNEPPPTGIEPNQTISTVPFKSLVWTYELVKLARRKVCHFSTAEVHFVWCQPNFDSDFKLFPYSEWRPCANIAFSCLKCGPWMISQ